MSAARLSACCVALCLSLAAGQGKKAQKELESAYRTWPIQDVAYIITDEERQAFNRLQTDEEREQFIEQFWMRRDPTPDTVENEFKEEHYRRIAYANERFASGIAGWRTDRGRIYITFGPPDEIEAYPTGTHYQRPLEQGGGQTISYPFEKWRYRYIEDIGTDVVFEFVDRSQSGEYRLALDPTEKDALQHVTPGTQPTAPDPKQSDHLQQYVKAFQPPKVRFNDLKALVDSTIRYNLLPMNVRADFLRLTDSTVLTPVTIELDAGGLEYKQQHATVNLHLRITSMTQRLVSVAEDVLSVEGPSSARALWQKLFYLMPGVYRLNVVAKDVNAGNTGTFEMAIRVPQFDPDKLAASEIILADQIERVGPRSINAGPFVIGEYKVRPRLSGLYRRDERLGFYLQVYETTGGSLAYELLAKGATKPAFSYAEELGKGQPIVAKILPLNTLEPGQYTLKIAITDRSRNQTLTQSAAFSVR